MGELTIWFKRGGGVLFFLKHLHFQVLINLMCKAGDHSPESLLWTEGTGGLRGGGLGHYTGRVGGWGVGG